MTSRALLVVTTAALGLACACTESEPEHRAAEAVPESPQTPGATGATRPQAALAALAASEALPAPARAEAGAPAPSSVPSPDTKSRNFSRALATPTSDAGTECGTKPLPDCPLQAWMKQKANPPVLAKDAPTLAAVLDEIASFAPPDYPNWASISKDGAAAARMGDVTAAKASCRGCHDQYKQKYKSEHRSRKL